jgi:hypothetical protein
MDERHLVKTGQQHATITLISRDQERYATRYGCATSTTSRMWCDNHDVAQPQRHRTYRTRSAFPLYLTYIYR